MPVYRYNGGGSWQRLRNIFRYNGSGSWIRMKNLFRYEGAGVWRKIFSAIGTIAATTNPTFRNGVNIDPDVNTPASLFFAGQTLTLTRGAYTEDGAALPTTTDVKYELKIFRKAVTSVSESYSEDLTTWDEITGSTVNFLGNAGSTASSSTSYTVTNVDANINGAGQGYRFAGRVRVTTNANDAVPDWENFRIIHQYGVAKVNHSISSFTRSNITQNGATFSWQVSGLPTTNRASYIYNQKLEVKRSSDNVVVYTQENIAPASDGSTSIVISDPNILSQTQYYGALTVTANDPWKTSNWPTVQTETTTAFTTTGAAPINTVAPTISPQNNRSRVPVNTQLSSSTGTWINVQPGATYQYQWRYDDGNIPTTTSWSTSNTLASIPTSYAANGSVTVKVRVTNPDGGVGETDIGSSVAPNSYLLDPEITIGTINPSTTNVNVSTNFNFTVSNYPTSYVINWGDGTSNFVSPSIAQPAGSFSIQNASGNGTTVTYTTASTHTIVKGSTVTITGISPSSYNMSNMVVTSVTSNQFTVSSGATGSYLFGGSVSTNTSVIYANEPHTYTSGGNKTITVTAQPGNKQNNRTILVNATGTIGVTGGSPSGFFVTAGSSLTVTNSGWPTGTTLIYQWYRTRSASNLDDLALGTTVSQSSTIVGERLYCLVYYSNSSLGIPTTYYGMTDYYRIVPTAPSYTLTNNGDGTATISGVSSTGGTGYYGTWNLNSGSNNNIASSTSPTLNATNTNISSGAGTLNTRLYSSFLFTYYSGATERFSSWEYTDRSVTVTTLSKLSTPTGVTASDNRTDGINITWNAVSGAAYYGVWYGPTPSYNSTPDFQNITTTSYLDTSMGAGVTRDYYVQAFRSGNPANTKSDWGGPDSGTRIAAVSPPSGGSVSLTGNSTPGSIITASTSGWSGSPTSYDVFITTSTSGTPTSNSTRVAQSNGTTSCSYTITSTDALAPANIFRAFATASNSGGTSSIVQSTNIITATSGGSAPATPTGVGLTGSGVVSWTASSGATSYEIEFFTAQNGTGLNAAPNNGTGTGYTVTGISSSPYQLVSPYASPNNWARVRVRARNSVGVSAYSAWVPSATTYT